MTTKILAASRQLVDIMVRDYVERIHFLDCLDID